MQIWSFMAVSFFCFNSVCELTFETPQRAEKSSTTNRRWRISQETIPFDKIFLIALYSLGNGIWQADMAVDF